MPDAAHAAGKLHRPHGSALAFDHARYQARSFFDKALVYSNHLGLFSEEIGPRGQHLGNFPQAFTHLSLNSAAYDLDRRLSLGGRPE